MTDSEIFEAWRFTGKKRRGATPDRLLKFAKLIATITKREREDEGYRCCMHEGDARCPQ